MISWLRCIVPILYKSLKPKKKGYPKEIEPIVEHIRARRMDLGLLQKNVAKILNLTCSSIENWKRNWDFPNKKHMFKIKKFLRKSHEFTEPENELGMCLKEYRKEH